MDRSEFLPPGIKNKHHVLQSNILKMKLMAFFLGFNIFLILTFIFLCHNLYVDVRYPERKLMRLYKILHICLCFIWTLLALICFFVIHNSGNEVSEMSKHGTLFCDLVVRHMGNKHRHTVQCKYHIVFSEGLFKYTLYFGTSTYVIMAIITCSLHFLHAFFVSHGNQLPNILRKNNLNGNENQGANTEADACLHF